MVDDNLQRKEFHELLELNQKIVFKVSNTYCRTPVDREDLVQEIFLQLWRAFPSFDRSRKFSTWIYRIALNVAISWLRKQKRALPVNSEAHVEEIANTARDSFKTDNVEELYMLIDGLDPLNRALLMLVLEDHSHREIADILGITETNVATKISRLKAMCRKVVQSKSEMKSSKQEIKK